MKWYKSYFSNTVTLKMNLSSIFKSLLYFRAKPEPDLSNIKRLTSRLPKRTVLVNKDNIFLGFFIDTDGKK